MNDGSAKPTGEPTGTGRWLIKTAIWHLAFTVACAAFFIRVAPHYFLIFRDFDLALPGATLMTLQVSMWLGDNWFLLVPALVVELIVLGIARAFLSRSLAKWLSILILAAMVGATCLAYVSLLIPMQRLTTKVS